MANGIIIVAGENVRDCFFRITALLFENSVLREIQPKDNSSKKIGNNLISGFFLSSLYQLQIFLISRLFFMLFDLFVAFVGFEVDAIYEPKQLLGYREPYAVVFLNRGRERGYK